MKTPYPHQLVDKEYLLSGRVRYLAHDPRTGKTLATVLAAKQVPGRLLVVCPVQVLEVWVSELRDWGYNAEAWGTGKKHRAKCLEAEAFIVNYESSWRIQDLDLGKYSLVVFDEAHKLSSHKSKVVQFWHKADIGGKKVWYLSGTPGIETPLQLAVQLFAGQKSILGYRDFHEYLWDHWRWDDVKYKWKPKKRGHALDLLARFKKAASFRKQETLGMAPKLYQEITVDLSGHGILHQAIADTQGKPRSVFAQRVQILSGICKAKIDFTCLYASETEGSVLITCAYVDEVGEIAKRLNCPAITGANLGDRERIRQEFSAGKHKAVVAQVKCIEAGVDFSRADTHIYHSNAWGGATRAQSEDRTRRLDKKKSSLIVDIIAVGEGLVDQDICDAVKGKVDFNESLIKEGQNGRHQ